MIEWPLIVKGAILVSAFFLGFASSYYFGPDNSIEEASEEFIKKQSGIDIDLSPSSPEKRKK